MVLALAPSFLRAICSIPRSGIAKFVVNVCSPDTNKNTNKTDAAANFYVSFQCTAKKSGIEPAPQVIVITVVFSMVPLAGNRLFP
jgi:hypothetical protein